MKFLRTDEVVYTTVEDDGATVITSTYLKSGKYETNRLESGVYRSENISERLERTKGVKVTYLDTDRLNNFIFVGFEDRFCEVLDGESLKSLFSTDSCNFIKM